MGIVLIFGLFCRACDSPTSSIPTRPDDFSVKYAGREQLKKQLKDPDSLQVISETVEWRADGPHYTAKYRAKNGFGGYVEDVYFSY